MAITILTKSEKEAANLRDAVRIMAWSQFKADNDTDLKGLDLYEIFKVEWLMYKIHTMLLPEIHEFVSNLGYTPEELMQIRSEYYANKKEYTNRTDEFQQSVTMAFRPTSYELNLKKASVSVIILGLFEELKKEAIEDLGEGASR